jgi:hypothetical protein
MYYLLLWIYVVLIVKKKTTRCALTLIQKLISARANLLADTALLADPCYPLAHSRAGQISQHEIAVFVLDWASPRIDVFQCLYYIVCVGLWAQDCQRCIRFIWVRNPYGPTYFLNIFIDKNCNLHCLKKGRKHLKDNRPRKACSSGVLRCPQWAPHILVVFFVVPREVLIFLLLLLLTQVARCSCTRRHRGTPIGALDTIQDARMSATTTSWCCKRGRWGSRWQQGRMTGYLLPPFAALLRHWWHGN